MTRTRHRAFSLLEVLLASTLAVLLLGIVLGILVPMLRASKQLDRRNGLTLAASHALAELIQEGQQTQAGGLEWHLLARQKVFSVHKIRDQQDTGSAVYSPNVTLFLLQDSSLRRLSFPPAPAGISSLPGIQRPYHWSDADLQLTLASQPGSLLVDHVDEFEITGITPQGVTVPIQIVLRLSFEGVTMTTTRSFFPLITSAS